MIWQDDNALRVPSSALFRSGQSWAVFVVKDSVAELRQIDIGRNNGIMAELRSGLNADEAVVLYPSTAIADGTRVAPRVVN